MTHDVEPAEQPRDTSEVPTSDAPEVTESADNDATDSPTSSESSDGTSQDGGVGGYRANRTLPVGVELSRQTGRRRTRWTLGFLAVLPLLILLAFELGEDGDGTDGLAEMATTSGLNFTLFTVAAAAQFLLVVVVALFFGDTVAAEASWSSLKYLLAAPIPRARLLRQKALVSAILAFTGLIVLTLVALTVGMLWYGSGELVLPSGAMLAFPGALAAIAGVCAYLCVHLMWIASLALLLSVSTDAPLGAVGGAVLVSILSQIIDEIGALGDLRVYLPTHYGDAWRQLLSEDIDWATLTNGVFSALAYASVFTALALIRFRRKDITG